MFTFSCKPGYYEIAERGKDQREKYRYLLSVFENVFEYSLKCKNIKYIIFNVSHYIQQAS